MRVDNTDIQIEVNCMYNSEWQWVHDFKDDRKAEAVGNYHSKMWTEAPGETAISNKKFCSGCNN